MQQEKQKLNNDISKYKKSYEHYQENFKTLSTNYETAVKEKMLMKLEKDRLLAKMDNLESSLRQIEENQAVEMKERSDMGKTDALSRKSGKTGAGAAAVDPKNKTKTQIIQKPATQIPPKDRPNPFLSEQFEPVNSRMQM